MVIIPDKLRRPAEVERDELRKQLADARAEIERKDKLIEQMREALKMALSELESEQNNEWGEPVWHQEEIEQIKAALAAERGE